MYCNFQRKNLSCLLKYNVLIKVFSEFNSYYFSYILSLPTNKFMVALIEIS